MEQIHYLQEYDVLVCRQCRDGVRPEHIDSHFKGNLHGVAKDERMRILTAAYAVRSAFEDTIAENTARTPPANSAPISALRPPGTDGFRCTFPVRKEDGETSDCGHVLGSVKNMEMHCRIVHGWKSSAPRGRPRRRANGAGKGDRPWRAGVHYQRFYRQGPRSTFFEVSKGVDTADIGSEGTEETDAGDRLIGRIEERHAQQEEAERNQMLNIDETKEPDPWQRRVGVGRYLREAEHLDKAQIREFAYRPVDKAKEDGRPAEECYILEVHRAFRRLVWRARTNAVLEKVGIFALFEVERRVTGEESNRPFNANIRRNTIRRYRHFWNGIWTFVLRTWDLPTEERPPCTVTSEQKRLLGKVVDEAEKAAAVRRKPGTTEQDEEDDAHDTQFHGAAAMVGRKASREGLEDAILDLTISLLDHALKDDVYESILISALAALSIEEDGSFGDLEDFLPRVSAVIKFARLMVLQKARRLRERDIERDVRIHGSTEAAAAAAVEGHVARVTRMVHQFMIRAPRSKREPRPMDWLIKLRTYGLHIQYTTPIAGQVYWVGDVLHYRSLRFSMDSLREFVRGVIADMRRILFEHLLLVGDGTKRGADSDDWEELAATTLPRIDWNWVDNPTEKAVGWSFLKDIRNRFEVDGRQWLARRILGSRALSKRFVRRERGEAQWVKRSLDQYRRFADRFLEKLLVAMHFTAGQPARAPEIMSLRHRNTANGGVRNIFIDQGLVVFVTMYHKNYERTGKLNPIQRFLPREVGGPLLQYIWLVLPFLEGAQALTPGDAEQPTQAASAFLWGDRSLISAGESGSSASSEDGANSDENNKSVAKRKRRTPASRWRPELMRRLVKRETERLMKTKVGVSTWRQVAPAISRKYLRCKFQAEPQPGQEAGLEDEYENEYETGVVRDSPWDGQGGHRSFTAGMVYGRLIFEAEYESMGIRAQFRAVSEDWHRFLHMPSSMVDVEPCPAGSRRNPSSYWEKAGMETSLERWKLLADVDTRAQLKTLVGHHAEFRSVQEASLRAIMRRGSPLLVVMGTGAGKSMCFMLPASCSPGGVTVVIVPLTSLQGDLHDRCRALGIASIIWNSRRPHETAPLIFVTPESALSGGFGGLLARLVAAHQLERVVVDECHTVLDGNKDFRPKLRELGDLALQGVQMVYLTATLPPRDEGEFFDLMYIDRAKARQFRGVTTRENVRYQVIDMDIPEPTYDVLGRLIEDSLEEAVQKIVEQKLRQYAAPAKIIVYSGTIDAAKRLASRMGCSVFYSQVDTRDGKLALLADWIHGRGPGTTDLARRVIVASNALGLGIDVPDIRAVVHFGWLRRLKNYGQESGRAGRDGLPSEAMIVRRRPHRQRPTADAGADLRLGHDVTSQFPDIDEFTGGQYCRRRVLDMVMDGRMDRVHCEEGELRCDVCERATAQAVPQRGSNLALTLSGREHARAEAETGALRLRVGNMRADVVENIERLRDLLEQWIGKCMLCYWLESGAQSESHTLVDCMAELADGACEGVFTMQREMRKWSNVDEFSGCSECLLPQELCGRWQSRGDAGGWELAGGCEAECTFPGVLVSTFVCLWLVHHEEVTPFIYELMGRDGVQFDKPKQRYSWFGKQMRWADVEANRLCDLVVQLACRHQTRHQ